MGYKIGAVLGVADQADHVARAKAPVFWSLQNAENTWVLIPK